MTTKAHTSSPQRTALISVIAAATPTFKGESKTLSVTLKPGTYKFYCSVPGHRMAGMEGTLVVK